MTRLMGTNIFNAVDMLYVCKERNVTISRTTLCIKLPRLDRYDLRERTITIVDDREEFCNWQQDSCSSRTYIQGIRLWDSYNNLL